MYYHPSFPDWRARITTVTSNTTLSRLHYQCNALSTEQNRELGRARGFQRGSVEGKGDRRSNCRDQTHLLKLLFSSQVSNKTLLSQPALLRVANKLRRQNLKHDFIQLHCALAQVPMPERLCSGQSCS